MPLQRRILAKIRDELFERIGVENRALHILRAGIFAALQLQHLQSALGHRIGGGIAGRPGADDDGIETFSRAIRSSSTCKPIDATRRARNASVSAGRNSMASAMMPTCANSKIGAFGSVLMATISVGSLDTDAMLDRTRNAGGDIELRPDGLAGLADLPVRGDPALLHQRPRAAIFGAENLGQIFDQLEILHRAQAEAAGDHDIRIGELRLIGIAIGR